MASRVSVSGQSNKPFVPASRYDDDPIFALLKIEPSAGGSDTRSQLNLVLVVDASGTMYNFQLSADEREYWLNLALSRNEMERGSADDRDAVYWSGQTLDEMQGIVHKPMTIAVDAIKQLLAKLEPGDKVSVVAFADSPYKVFTQDDWRTRPDYCRTALDQLLDQKLPFDIGTGTHMSDALHQAGDMLVEAAMDNSTDRIIVISDGIVQDRRETFEAMETARDKGFAISTIGVGEEFDEEFLTKVADTSRGEYYYAADIKEITEKLLAELTIMKASSMHRAHIAAEGLSGAVVQDVYMVSPSMNIFDEMDTGGGTLRARIGDLNGDRPTILLLQIASALMPEGQHPLADVTLSWDEGEALAAATGQTAATNLMQGYSDDPNKLAQRNPEVQDYVDRFMVYKYEREAQRQQERGDIVAARASLGAATRELQKLGETNLAQDLEQQIASMGSGLQDPSRIKRIKATTRKLADKSPSA